MPEDNASGAMCLCIVDKNGGSLEGQRPGWRAPSRTEAASCCSLPHPRPKTQRSRGVEFIARRRRIEIPDQEAVVHADRSRDLVLVQQCAEVSAAGQAARDQAAKGGRLHGGGHHTGRGGGRKPGGPMRRVRPAAPPASEAQRPVPAVAEQRRQQAALPAIRLLAKRAHDLSTSLRASTDTRDSESSAAADHPVAQTPRPSTLFVRSSPFHSLP